MTFSDIANPIICILICLRLICYQRNGSPYRFRHSVVAYLLTASVGGIGICSVTAHQLVEYFQSVLLAVLCVSLYAVRGNTAELFRVSE